MKKRLILIIILLAVFTTSPIFASDIVNAAKSGNLEKVKTLLKQDPTLINTSDTWLYTPLHWALGKKHDDVALFLISKGADVNAKAKNGSTPLHMAARWGRLKLAQMLIQKGSDVNALNEFGNTPLHFACDYGYLDIVELLIRNKAKVNLQEKDDGSAPLHLAARQGHKEVVEFLLKNGADKNLKDNKGFTALQVAKMNGKGEVVKVLSK